MTVDLAILDSFIRMARIALIVVGSAIVVALFLGVLLLGSVISVPTYSAFRWLAAIIGTFLIYCIYTLNQECPRFVRQIHRFGISITLETSSGPIASTH